MVRPALMFQDPAPIIAALALLAFSTAFGMIPMIKLIRVYEARHELRQGSAGRLRGLAGWSIIAFWLMSAWFCATVIGDWGVTGDLDGAIERSWLRLQILLEIAIALTESD